MPETEAVNDTQRVTRHDKLVCPPLFCDTTNMHTSKFGVSIKFGHALVSNDEELIVDDYVVVGMTVEHAASLHEVLGAHLHRFAQKNGPIRGYPQFGSDGGVAGGG